MVEPARDLVLVVAAALAVAGYRHTTRNRGAAAPGSPPRRTGRRIRREQRAVAEALDAIAVELRGGAAVSSATIAVAKHGAADVAELLAEPVVAVEAGVPFVTALAEWGGAEGSEARAVVGGGLAVAAASGGRAAGALEHLAAGVRERVALEDEIRALSTQARVSAWVVGAAPVAYLAFSATVDPSTVGRLLANPIARLAVAAGLLLDGLAVVWMRAIVRRVVS